MEHLEHLDWTAWDAWMEANAHLVQQGFVPTCEEITRLNDLKGEPPGERDRNIADFHKFNRNVAALEESRLARLEK